MTETVVLWFLSAIGSLAVLIVGAILTEIRGLRKDNQVILIKATKHEVKIAAHDSRICSLEKLSEIRTHN